MPPVGELLTTFVLDPVAIAVALIAAILYGVGVRAVHRKPGISWPARRVWAFYVLGLGVFLLTTCGFLGTYSAALRWVFCLKLAVLLFVVPLLVTMGRPLLLASLAIPDGPVRHRLAALVRWPLKFFGNPAVGPLVGLVVFGAMLTPIAAAMRLNPVFSDVLTVLIPLLGLAVVLPMTEAGTRISSSIFVVELVFALIELLADAVPGIFLRLATSVLDHAPAVAGAHPGWFPNPLRDQQLAGDWLWFVAEVADVPLLILMFMRFQRSDRQEGAALDALTDEEMDALNDAHFQRFTGTRADHQD